MKTLTRIPKPKTTVRGELTVGNQKKRRVAYFLGTLHDADIDFVKQQVGDPRKETAFCLQLVREAIDAKRQRIEKEAERQSIEEEAEARRCSMGVEKPLRLDKPLTSDEEDDATLFSGIP